MKNACVQTGQRTRAPQLEVYAGRVLVVVEAQHARRLEWGAKAAVSPDETNMGRLSKETAICTFSSMIRRHAASSPRRRVGKGRGPIQPTVKNVQPNQIPRLIMMQLCS